ERELHVARRDRRGRTAARAAREPSRRDRVRNGPVVRVLRGDPVRELVQVRLPGNRVSRLLEQPHRICADGRNMVGKERGAVRRRESRRVQQVLDGHRLARIRLLRTRQPDPFHYWKWRYRNATPMEPAKRSTKTPNS